MQCVQERRGTSHFMVSDLVEIGPTYVKLGAKKNLYFCPVAKQESPADARVTRNSAVAVIPGQRLFQDGRQPPSWILSNRK